jgi:hypothetical protein
MLLHEHKKNWGARLHTTWEAAVPVRIYLYDEGTEAEEGENVLCWPPRQSMACTKLRWRSALHLILGSLDRMYRLTTVPFLPPPPPPPLISWIASEDDGSSPTWMIWSSAHRALARNEPNLPFCSLLSSAPPSLSDLPCYYMCKPCPELPHRQAGCRFLLSLARATAPASPSWRRPSSSQSQVAAPCTVSLSVSLARSLLKRRGATAREPARGARSAA